MADYNKTLNLPQTDFPMKAGLAAREPGMLENWEKMDLYHELLKKNQGKELFYLHDGPTFSNGALHMGHALNKSIKDFIVRAAAMRGYYTPYVPGWDNHGMPIESAIIKQNKLNRKQMSVPEFRSACHDFAQHYVDVQMEGFKRLGALGDWEHPYKTMDPSFEAEEVKIFGEMYQKGYIYKGLKPVYWCPSDETALAEAEIEYQDDPCTTAYVKFAMKDDLGKLPGYEKDKLFFVIWTTTIWTLPGNLAIALHPRDSYVLVKAENGETYIMAEALTEKVMKAGGFDTYEILEKHPGAFFENMLAQHPFLDKTSRLLLAEYVTMDSGTGCVHTAPGFGADDYQTCRRYGMEMVVPVDDRGRHTEYAGKYAGMKTEESNSVILEDMKESGALFASEEIVHSYPHCWRCKKPIIFRATPQWFCSVDAFKEAAVAACEQVRWVPSWGKDRMIAMIRERADWCISRQRRWGLPIPVFYCQDCGKPVCTAETIAAVSKLFEEKGSNAWYELEAEQILPAGYPCPHCGGVRFTKEEDTLDGWFDSGSSHVASMKRDQGFWPANVYMEGLDQYRGWFQSSLLTAVGALGKGAPFKECVTHGWTVDGNGKAMHKSLGNGVDPADIFQKYGADMIRLWAGSADYHADVRCSDAIFKQLSQSYLKFRNTARYCLGNLDGFDPDNLVGADEMLPLDRWAVTRLNQLIEKCFAAYDDFLRGGPFQLLFGYHQRSAVLRGSKRLAPSLCSNGALDDFGHYDQGLCAHFVFHLRRNLAGHASPQPGRRAQRDLEPDESTLCGIRPVGSGDGGMAEDDRFAGRRESGAGGGAGRQGHRQAAGSRRYPVVSGAGGLSRPVRQGGFAAHAVYRLPGGDQAGAGRSALRQDRRRGLPGPARRGREMRALLDAQPYCGPGRRASHPVRPLRRGSEPAVKRAA